MLIQKFYKKVLVNFTIVTTILATAVGMFTAFTPNAFAGIGISVAPNFSSPMTAGQTAVPVSMDITNGSGGGTTNIVLDNIYLTPACGDTNVPCTTPDPGVFLVSTNATGTDACLGNSFSVSISDAATGKVQFTPSSQINLALGAKCTINFTVDVLKVPSHDLIPGGSVQTAQGGQVTAHDPNSGDLPGSGTGTNAITVNPVSPSISTIPSQGGPVGTVLNDTATLSGGVNPTGNVTFKLYSPSDVTCSSTPVYTYTDSAAPYATTPGFTSTETGTYRWVAEYSGDASNNPVTSGCQEEQVTVNKLTPVVVTEIHNASHTPITTASVGDTVHDSAVVTGSSTQPTGNVTFSFFDNGTCTGIPVATSSAFALSSGSVDATTFTQTALPPSAAFKAQYEGNSIYNSAEGVCEPLTVSKKSPSISTTPSSGGVVGTVLNDTASLTGGYNPTGNVTFKLYSPADTICQGPAAYTEVDSAAPYQTSTGFVSNEPGVWRWTAEYAGDVNNNSVSSGCQEEQVTIVGKPDVHVAKTAANGTINAGETASFTITTSNAGPGTATSVVTSDTLPAGLIWAENPDNPNCTIVSGVLTCSYESLAQGASDSVTVQAVTNSQVCGTLNNVANVTAANEDPAQTGDNSARAAITVVCPVITRTLGFWQTHTNYTESVFDGINPITLGGMVINSYGKLFGGFYAGISKTSSGGKRSSIDQARMQLTQQYLAAVLNCKAFGCPTSIQNLINQASIDFASGTKEQILSDASALDAYNNSGDNMGTVNAGSATPQASKGIANIPFWDLLH